MARTLVDTNILVYALDRTEARKQAVAQAILDALASAGEGCVSAQNLSECYAVLRRKGRSHEDCAAVVRAYAANLIVFPVTTDVLGAALDGCAAWRLAWWDALIWACASQNDVGRIMTEDSQSASVIGGVEYMNPFL